MDGQGRLLDQDEARCLAIVRVLGPIAVDAAAARVGLSVRRARQVLGGLAAAGLVARVGAGPEKSYDVTEWGRKCFERVAPGLKPTEV